MNQAGAPRLGPRARVRLRIDLTPRWDGALSVRMETIDLSGSGAAVRSPIFLPLKTQVSVDLALPPVGGRGAIRILCEAVVVNVEEIGHTRQLWRAGIYFLDLGERERSALKRFIYGAAETGERWSPPAAQSGGGTP